MPPNPEQLAAWQQAQAYWPAHLRLAPPVWCQTRAEVKAHSLEGQLAQVQLASRKLTVNLPELEQRQLKPHLVALLAHELGHLAYTPASLQTYTRMLAYTAAALGPEAGRAPEVLNYYLDLLVNHRLWRYGAPIQALLAALAAQQQPHPLNQWLNRIYELLWRLPAQTLCQGAEATDMAEADALLMSQLLLSQQKNFVQGANAFAQLCQAYLQPAAEQGAWNDLCGESGDMAAAFEKALGLAAQPPLPPDQQAELEQLGLPQPQQYLEPWELLAASGLEKWSEAGLMQYYREQAWPYLKRRPQVPPDQSELTLMGSDTWQLHDPVQQLDWGQTLSRSPVLIPGVTTLQQEREPDQAFAGNEPLAHTLDIYLDTSGSVADPAQQRSLLVVAAFVLILSALRQGQRVRLTSWSSQNQLQSTAYLLQEVPLLKAALKYAGGATNPPMALLEQRYTQSLKGPSQLIFLSDQGLLQWLQSPAHLEAWERIGAHHPTGGLMLLQFPDQRAPRERFQHWQLRSLTDSLLGKIQNLLTGPVS